MTSIFYIVTKLKLMVYKLGVDYAWMVYRKSQRANEVVGRLMNRRCDVINLYGGEI